MSSEPSYDFIVVGAGSAGCVLANRLSADPSHRVLLLEAGPAGHPLSRIPISFGRLMDNPAANWCYRSQPEDNTRGRPIPVPRGRVLGGSSTINGLVFVRGQRLDYDTWAQLGNRGWSYDDVLPLFRRMESFAAGEDDLRGRDGPLKVTVHPDRSPLYEALFAAGEQIGVPHNPDYNGDSQEGVCKTQTTISRGRRMSTAHCFLDPVRSRPNLEVRTGALARELLLDGRTCVGVRFDHGGRSVTARARGEVVVSAGAVASPQLLELSGIGQPEVLRAHGIEVRHALPGVGENLRDHITPRLMWRTVKPKVTYNDRARGLGLVWHVLRYAVRRDGFLNLPSAPVVAFLRTRDELASPDIQLHFMPFIFNSVNKRDLAPTPGFSVSCYQLRPESTGSIHIRSAEAREHPAIHFNFLSDALDRRTLIDGMRLTRKLVAAPALDGIRGDELRPGPGLTSDDELLDWVRATAETAYHPVGTCKMGPDGDPMAVVDDRLRVRGIDRLRVADGAIMPTLVSGNTNAACIMIGERASDLVLEAARARRG
ncbi:MAG: GMC family oxidoreductase N-terminal domain-containing protein [Ectothiorhodospiraceae bacterium]|nr:GMC family oxidoreductase N-terminal domain-containing protein [Ectothiorhodospiraceae bacterium]